MRILNYIVWDPNPDLFPTLLEDLTISPRYYGLLFALGFLISQQILFYVFRQENKPERDVETLTIFMVLATLIGARLGHVLFYEPEVYLPNPLDILKVWKGGLASHGAAFGILTALYIYVNYQITMDLKWRFPFVFFKSKKEKTPGQSYLWVVDRIVIVVALTGCLIRFGNFMNSEIHGKPSGDSYGVVFARAAEQNIEANPAIEAVDASKGSHAAMHNGQYVPVDLIIQFKNDNYPEKAVRNYLEIEVRAILSEAPSVNEHLYQPAEQRLIYDLSREREGFKAHVKTWGIARHPAQLYESFTCLILFFILFFIWKRKKEHTPEGLLLGIFLIYIFGVRFLYEFLKENQVDFENDLALNMGQWLSIPLIIAGIYLLVRISKRKSNDNQAT